MEMSYCEMSGNVFNRSKNILIWFDCQFPTRNYNWLEIPKHLTGDRFLQSTSTVSIQCSACSESCFKILHNLKYVAKVLVSSLTAQYHLVSVMSPIQFWHVDPPMDTRLNQNCGLFQGHLTNQQIYKKLP